MSLFLLLWLVYAAPQASVADSGAALVPGSTSMETAWDVPRDPSLVPPAGEARLVVQIRLGFDIFRETPRFAARFTGGGISCNNCHLNAGQREKALPLVGVAGAFPEFSKRSGKLLSLEDRIVGCFLRSENATGIPGAEEKLSTGAPEVLALAAYITWISEGYPVGGTLPWRGQNVIPAGKLIRPGKIDAKRGEALFIERCSNCHGEDGQGVAIGDKKAGPLWGPGSWNDGAGAARIYTLAGIIRYSMPYVDPGSLTDEEALEIAAYINSRPRPSFPGKLRDFPGGDVPEDAVYYKK